MCPLVPKRRDDCRMIIFPASDSDAGGLSHRRVAPFGSDQQRRSDRSPVFKTHLYAEIAPLHGCRLGLPHQPDIPAFLGAGEQRRAQMAVLVHPAQGFFIVARIERQPAGIEPVGHLDPADGAALDGEMIADADRVEHPLRRGAKRAGAPVERSILAQVGIGRIDDDRGKAAGIQRRGKRQADQATAQDDHVCSVHAPSLVVASKRGKSCPGVRRQAL